MDWQQIISLGIVGMTALLLLRKGFGNNRGGPGKCNSGCRCDGTAPKPTGKAPRGGYQ